MKEACLTRPGSDGMFERTVEVKDDSRVSQDQSPRLLWRRRGLCDPSPSPPTLSTP